MGKALLMWGPSLQSRAGAHLKESAKPPRVTLLTEPSARHARAINSAAPKKPLGTASQAQTELHWSPQPFQKETFQQQGRHTPASLKAKEAWMFVLIKSSNTGRLL